MHDPRLRGGGRSEQNAVCIPTPPPPYRIGKGLTTPDLDSAMHNGCHLIGHYHDRYISNASVILFSGY